MEWLFTLLIKLTLYWRLFCEICLPVLIVLGGFSVGAGRFVIPSHDLSWAGTYEAFAHMWVGAMLVVVLSDRFEDALRFWAGIALGTTTVIELAMFAVFKLWK